MKKYQVLNFLLILTLLLLGCSNNSIIKNKDYQEIKNSLIAKTDFKQNSNYLSLNVIRREIVSIDVVELEFSFFDAITKLEELQIMIIDSKEKNKESNDLYPSSGIVDQKLTLLGPNDSKLHSNEYRGIFIYFDISNNKDIDEVLIYLSFRIDQNIIIEYISQKV